MNALTLPGLGATWKLHGSRVFGLAAAGLLALSGVRAFSQATVTTLGGNKGGAADSCYTYQQATFNFPAGIALDPSDTMLFLADYNNDAVRMVTQLGDRNNSFTYKAFGSAQGISHPIAVAVDLQTNVYVLNYGSGKNGTLMKFNGSDYANYLYLNAWTTNATQLTNATALALDYQTNAYITVQSNTVIKISAANVATVVGVITNAGTYLRGIAVMDDGRLALSDAGNNGIWMMDPANTNLNHNAVKYTGFHGAGDQIGAASFASFNGPATLAKAGNGVLVVADYNNAKVKIVSTNGTVTRLFGVNPQYWYGSYPGWADGTVNPNEQQDLVQCRQPYGLAVAHDGTVYDTEDNYCLLREATGTGLTGPSEQSSASTSFIHPSGIALNPGATRLAIADQGSNAIRLLNLSDNQTSLFLDTNQNISQPVSVLYDTNDNLYVLNQGSGSNGSILEFDPFGNQLATVATNLNVPTGFTMDGAGTLFVCEQAGRVRVVSPSGLTTTLVTITNGNVSLQGIAVFDDGSLAVSDAGNHVIWNINAITKNISRLTGQFGVSGSTLGSSAFARLNQPHQLCRIAGDQLVVADTGNNRLVTLARNGSITNILDSTNALVWFGHDGDPADNTSQQFVSMVQPIGVAADNGKVFASETYYGDVRGLNTPAVSQPASNPVVPQPVYTTPAGIALNQAENVLYVADTQDNAVNLLNLNNNTTTLFLNASNGIDAPVDVAVDAADNLYVLNQGSGSNGSIDKFDRYGNFLGIQAGNLTLPTSMTFDSAGNILVACQTGAVQMISAGVPVTIATVTNSGVDLQGIALFDDGTIVASDAANQVIWQINPVTKAVSRFTGQLHDSGANFGSPSFARLSQPKQLARADGNLLLATDSGNNRIVVIDRSGAITNALDSTNALVWFGLSTDPHANNDPGFVSMSAPDGLVLAKDGAVFTSEIFFHDIRKILSTGLQSPGSGGGSDSGSSTNIVVAPPVITPNSGYFPMGQTILVSSPNPEVYYTTDGTDPTTNSTPVNMSGNIGYIHWFNPTNDLTGLRVRAFMNGTNSSSIVSGQPVASGAIGVPPGPQPSLQAGIGSTIIVPIVSDLPADEQVQSFQFRFEIAPANNNSTPALTPLSIIPTNDFVPLVTAAQSGFMATNAVTPYTQGVTNGLVVYAVGSGSHVLFQHFAVVSLVAVHIPYSAVEGDRYSLNVLYPSATSDAYNDAVSLTPMPQATIVVTNIPYTVGDSASQSGGWYDAGTFGNDNLDNADVNQAFYAASGLRMPYTFSDVFNAMDAYPPDASGFVGGDGQIRYLDWMTILNRSLRLEPANWAREWSVNGILTDFTTNLVSPHVLTISAQGTVASTNWDRQVLLGATSVGNAVPGAQVQVPVYAKLADGASLSGMQFRAVIIPENGAPQPGDAPQLVASDSVASPLLAKTFKAGETAFGWPLDSFGWQSRSSNFLGWVTFRVPANAVAGQAYQLSLENADGSPDATTQYSFETRSATITVNAPAPSPSTCSDEWKAHYFGSATNAAAADNADPDGDGIPNWMEFLAGTDPNNAQSKLQLDTSGVATNSWGQHQMNLRWLTAPGHAYALQWSTNLVSGPWHTLQTVSGNGAITNCPDVNPSESCRYYRLYVLP